MLLHYLVKGGCSKFLPRAGFVRITLLRFGVKLSRQFSCSEATARHAQVVRRRFLLCFNRTAPWRISIQHATPSLSWSERDARNTQSSRRLCPFTEHISSKNSDSLSRSVMTTNNSAKQTIFSLLCANSVLIYFVTNNTFQRYVTNENI